MLLTELGGLFLRGIMTIVLALLAIGLVLGAFYPVISEGADFWSYYSSHWQIVLFLLGVAAVLCGLVYLSVWSILRDLREDVEDAAIDTVLGDGASIVYRTGKAMTDYKQAQEQQARRRAEAAARHPSRPRRKASTLKTVGGVVLSISLVVVGLGGMLWLHSALMQSSDWYEQVFHEVRRDQLPIVINGAQNVDWYSELEHAQDWIYTNSHGTLTVEDIVPTTVNPGSGGTWAVATLYRHVDDLLDFRIDVEYEWDSENSLRAMQKIFIQLVDVKGNLLVQAGHNDAWSGQTGGHLFKLADNVKKLGYDTDPFFGNASLSIMRENGEIKLYWNDELVMTGHHVEKIHRLEIKFLYYASSRGTFFGTERIKNIHVAETK
jgi:hypothetical protein